MEIAEVALTDDAEYKCRRTDDENTMYTITLDVYGKFLIRLFIAVDKYSNYLRAHVVKRRFTYARSIFTVHFEGSKLSFWGM